MREAVEMVPKKDEGQDNQSDMKVEECFIEGVADERRGLEEDDDHGDNSLWQVRMVLWGKYGVTAYYEASHDHGAVLDGLLDARPAVCI